MYKCRKRARSAAADPDSHCTTRLRRAHQILTRHHGCSVPKSLANSLVYRSMAPKFQCPSCSWTVSGKASVATAKLEGHCGGWWCSSHGQYVRSGGQDSDASANDGKGATKALGKGGNAANGGKGGNAAAGGATKGGGNAAAPKGTTKGGGNAAQHQFIPKQQQDQRRVSFDKADAQRVE